MFDFCGFRSYNSRVYYYLCQLENEMEKEFTDQMKDALFALKKEIIDTLIANNEDFRAIVEGLDPKDFADIASDDMDRKMLETIGSKDMKRMKLIDSAISRIEQGKYGLCMKCGKKIPKERLQAIPYALLCIECQSADERRNR
jgi:DnaK suppressor protein